MNDETKLSLFRWLEKVCESKLINIILFNFSIDRYGIHLQIHNKLTRRFHKLKYDYIDYLYGPSKFAEESAQRTGYWNLEAWENMFGKYIDSIPKQFRKKFIYITMRYMQVRKY